MKPPTLLQNCTVTIDIIFIPCVLKIGLSKGTTYAHFVGRQYWAWVEATLMKILWIVATKEIVKEIKYQGVDDYQNFNLHSQENLDILQASIINI
jgi:hypothetical protein